MGWLRLVPSPSLLLCRRVATADFSWIGAGLRSDWCREQSPSTRFGLILLVLPVLFHRRQRLSQTTVTMLTARHAAFYFDENSRLCTFNRNGQIYHSPFSGKTHCGIVTRCLVSLPMAYLCKSIRIASRSPWVRYWFNTNVAFWSCTLCALLIN